MATVKKKKPVKAQPKPPVEVRHHDPEGVHANPPRWNLICERGHWHYAPEPMGWVGRECLIRFVNANGRKVTCHKKMVLLKDYKPGPLSISKAKAKPVKKAKPKRRRFVSRY